MDARKKIKFTFAVFIIVIISFTLLIVLDFANISKYNLFKNPIFTYLVNNKGIIYIFFGFLLSVTIFFNQHYIGKDQAREYQEQIDELNDKVKKLNDDLSKLEAVKKERKEIEKIAINWFDETTDSILFYFPYTIFPGFWNDGGLFFRNSILGELNKLTEEDKIRKIIFRGPIPDVGDNYLEKIINSIVEREEELNNLIKDMQHDFKSVVLKNLNPPTHQAVKEDIKKSYESLYRFFEQQIEKKPFISYKLGEEIKKSYWLNKPNYSFVLRKMKNEDLQLLIIDTFGILKNNSNNINIIKPNNLMDNEINEGFLFKSPNNYIIENDSVLTLFISTLFQTVFFEDREIKECFLGE